MANRKRNPAYKHPSRMEKRNAAIVAAVIKAGNGSVVAEQFGLTRERIRQIWQTYGPSESLRDVHPVSATSLRKEAAAKKSIARKAAHKILSEKVIALYNKGESLHVIQDKLKTTRGRVQCILVKNGLRRKARRLSRDADIIKLMSKGVPQTEIARRLVATPQVIYMSVARLRRSGKLAA